MSDKHQDGADFMGEVIPNKNIQRFVKGCGNYMADLDMPGALEMLMVRSELAHGEIVAIDTTQARACPGVVAILTATDLAAVRPQPSLWDLEGQNYSNLKPLAEDRVRYVGQPYAAIFAKDRASAMAAAKLVQLQCRPLPAIASIDHAIVAGAPKLYPQWPDNVVARKHWQVGDVDERFARADVVISDRFTTQRVHPLSLETRGAMASPDPDGKGVTIWVGTQSIHQVRAAVSECLNVPEHRLRVIAPDVGGSFGMKACAYGEEILAAFAALRLGKPIRWAETRQEAFVSSNHGRDERIDLDLAVDKQGHILALKAQVVLDKGADPYATSIGTAWISGAVLTGPYRIDVVDIEALGVVTNKTPTAAYRGFGQPEANFALERALDLAANKLGLDPAEIRLRNFVPSSDMPYATATGMLLDSGHYGELLNKTLKQFDYVAARRKALERSHPYKRTGIGMSCYTEVTNFGPSTACKLVGVNNGGFDISHIRMEPSGHIRLFSSQTPMGQGIETALTQVCAKELTLSFEDVEVSCGDTITGAYTGYASGGSRGAGVSGACVALVSRKLAERLKKWAAHLMDVALEDVIMVQQGVQVKDNPTQRLSFAAIAKEAYFGANVPEGLEPGLEDMVSYDPAAFAVSYGSVAAEVEVDMETGAVRLVRMTFGHDCGVQINAKLVEGQIIGGITQAVGATLFEEVLYDDTAQPLILSLQDYLMPLAADMPSIDLLHMTTPTPFSPIGVKGVGESGTLPVPAAIASAVQDAIGYRVPLTTLPFNGPRVLEAIQKSVV